MNVKGAEISKCGMALLDQEIVLRCHSSWWLLAQNWRLWLWEIVLVQMPDAALRLILSLTKSASRRVVAVLFSASSNS